MAGPSAVNGESVRPWVGVAGAMLVAGILSPLAVLFWRTAAPIRNYVEYAGLIPRLEQLAAALGDHDLVIVESRNAGSDLHVLAVPLAYIYARHVLVLDSPVPAKRTLDDFIDWARTQVPEHLVSRRRRHRPAEPAHRGHSGRERALSGARVRLADERVPERRAPQGVRLRAVSSRPGAQALTPGPIDLTIGTLDDLNVVRFHAKEIHAETGDVFRWTRGCPTSCSRACRRTRAN